MKYEQRAHTGHGRKYCLHYPCSLPPMKGEAVCENHGAIISQIMNPATLQSVRIRREVLRHL